MSRAVIVGYTRSPFTPAYKGQLAGVRPDDLAATIIRALIAKTGVKAEDVEDVILGCAFPEGEQGFNLARMVGLLAGLPVTTAGLTVNRWCGSSMEAIHIAAGNIATGKGELFVAAGVESMSRIPMGGFNPLPNPALYATMPDAYIGMGMTAENVAKKFHIERKAQEDFALASHRKAAAANFADEITPITTKAGVVDTDGTIRANSTPEDLAKLNPVFDARGTVTAGTSSPLTDGAAAVIVASEAYAKKHKLPMLAAVKSMAVAGLEPGLMGLGPITASKKALARAGLAIKDMDVIELNEAFAAQSLPCIAELGCDAARVNVEGGALALGHPLGASGARITGKAALLLSRGKGKYALATACIGGGQGIATILERI
ncbi:MAG: thiolase family protein [Alphaproteobacteria bacterium]|nr:thiolase family protein [Alphaproteobacteria bacterium]